MNILWESNSMNKHLCRPQKVSTIESSFDAVKWMERKLANIYEYSWVYLSVALKRNQIINEAWKNVQRR